MPGDGGKRLFVRLRRNEPIPEKFDMPDGRRYLSAVPGKAFEAFYTIPDNDNEPELLLYTPAGERVFFRVLYGGRGSGKSETIARMLLAVAMEQKGICLCTRDYQNSIEDSVYKTIEEAAEVCGVYGEFRWLKTSIIHKITGYKFIFRGLQKINSIKSMKGLTHCWVEEAQTIPKETWQILEPTMRTKGAEIWVSFNPDQEADATYQRFVAKPRDDAVVVKVNFRDNPWFPEVLERQRILCLRTDPDAYDWIWEGNPRKLSHAVIFRDRMNYSGFKELSEEEIMVGGGRIFYGMDFGFADDPSAVIRFYIMPDKDEPERWNLYITHAQFGYHVELDDLGDMVRKVPGATRWPIKGDNSRPETISKLAGEGLNISAAEKWPGSIEDGITHMKGFKTIYVQAANDNQPGLVELHREFRLYSYKTDPKQLDQHGQPVILPVPIDRHNHGIDAIRYGLDGHIMKGGLGVWYTLAQAS